jgi:MerR family transcriptional regulator, redox-sensitive transcriptional activator SoxR
MDDWHVDGLTVGQVANLMGITRSAVRWYDDHGLLPSERTSGNQRRFFADVLCRVAMIRAAQRVGLSIAEIRNALTALPPRKEPTPEDWERFAGQLREVASRRIEELFEILNQLAPHDNAIDAIDRPEPRDPANKPASNLSPNGSTPGRRSRRTG